MEMNNRIDNGFTHESKIEEKHLSCPSLSGFNHLAVYLRWAYNKGLLSESLFAGEPRIQAALNDEEDLRDVIASSEYLKGKIRSSYFTEEGTAFTLWFYQFNIKDKYPDCVDKYARSYFGDEFNNRKFKGEAYLFVPYDESYYAGLSIYIEDAWNNRDQIKPRDANVKLPAVILTPGSAMRIFNNKPGHLPDKKKNREKIVNLANDTSKHLGKDKDGYDWNAQIEPDGSQTWVRYRDGAINNGGIFNPPRQWNDDRGLYNVGN